ncbi:DnaB-like helicase C-terminal domain-containing protein [Nostoc sphaeroides]|uniref:Replicative DNA helicase n=1 Tax=Nostoc sphaeroides CCNUC1 TaxID=2653204 RepID=A0A5P8WEA2_9NOSO|nr:DnaB-like helicase C-terminal domain-containing protein [Nostoc sphaeroides]QFS50872.1 replicative DNA helicase [Nostoc sphaeroides CCNUC1]
MKLGHDTTTELESVFDQSEQKIFNLTTNKQDQFQPKVIGDCLAAVFTKISQGSEPAYPTGLGDLDILIGGLVKQDLVIVAARASMGKTWLACHLTNHIMLVDDYDYPKELIQTRPQWRVKARPSERMFEKSFSVCFTTLATEKLLRENRSFGI